MEDEASSPLAHLLRALEHAWVELTGGGDDEEFMTWLEQTAVVGGEEQTNVAYGYLDSLDAFLIAAIEEVEELHNAELTSDQLEAELTAIWRRTYAFAAAQEEARLAEIWLARGRALRPDIRMPRNDAECTRRACHHDQLRVSWSALKTFALHFKPVPIMLGGRRRSNLFSFVIFSHFSLKYLPSASQPPSVVENIFRTGRRCCGGGWQGIRCGASRPPAKSRRGMSLSHRTSFIVALGAGQHNRRLVGHCRWWRASSCT